MAQRTGLPGVWVFRLSHVNSVSLEQVYCINQPSRAEPTHARASDSPALLGEDAALSV